MYVIYFYHMLQNCVMCDINRMQPLWCKSKFSEQKAYVMKEDGAFYNLIFQEKHYRIFDVWLNMPAFFVQN
jgi:hypothetical protein